MSEALQPEVPEQPVRITQPHLYSFSSKQELVQTLKLWAFANGFVLGTSSSSCDSFVYLICDRGYQNRRNEEEVRLSKKTGCVFQIYCRVIDGVWSNVAMDGVHSTHNFVDNLAAHAPFRRWCS
ncbi:hypothetical protein GEMRC1_000708 [Eukaryota sp. GEM-RC1]